MGAAFVAAEEHYDAGTGWPASITITDPPAGTSRGDRLILDIFAYGNNADLDNWGLGAAWTLLGSENGTSGVGGARSAIFRYTARVDDGIVPVTITPQTASNTAATAGSWYRAVVTSLTVSHPVNITDPARGGTTSDQPDDSRGAYSAYADDFVLQTTMVLNPSTRTLGSIISPSAITITDRQSFSAVTGRGGEIRVAGGLAPGTFSGAEWATYPLTGSGGSINVRSAISAFDAQPDESLWVPRVTFL